MQLEQMGKGVQWRAPLDLQQFMCLELQVDGIPVLLSFTFVGR